MHDLNACPDCGGARLRSLGALPDVPFFAGRVLSQALPGGRLWYCLDCDLRLRWPRLPDYKSYYDNAAVDAWTLDALRKDQRLVRALVESSADAKSVLDFGCYSGGLLAALPTRLAKYGVEVSASAAAMAIASAGARVSASLDELPAQLRFDIVIAMDVIEHVPSPRALLTQLLSRLAPGGELVITTGNGGNVLWQVLGSRWWYCYYPEHIAFISERWLRFHAPRMGAHVKRIETFNYLDDPGSGRAKRWQAMLKYLLWPARHARRRAQHLAHHGKDRGVPGLGLTRDHLLVVLTT